METLWQDLRYGFRMLARSPGFTAVAVLTLALGIGANTTVFSWIQSVLLHPLPGVEKGEQLVTLGTLTPSGEFIDSSYPDYRDYRDQAKSLAGVIAFKDRPLSLGDDEGTEQVWAELVSGNFFGVLGVKPAAGRFFLPEEQAEKPGAFPVAVLSHGLWKRRFNADPGVVGGTIKLNRQPFTVVGVAPEEFRGTIVGLSFDVYVLMTMQAQLTGGGEWLSRRRTRPLHLMARLGPGVSLEEANAEVQAIARQLAQAYPATNEDLGAILLPIWRSPHGAQGVLARPLILLMAVGGVVLLIVCANVANLLLARATTRQKEISIRLALGATRTRVVRQLLSESVLLALLGAAAGVLLAFWMVDSLKFFVPPTNLPVALLSKMDGQVFVFTLLLSVLTGVIFGLAPAVQATKPDLHESLKEGGRGSAEGSKSRRLRGLLVVSEIALALVALVGAGLFLKSFENAKKSNPGFDPENVLLIGINLSASGYDRDQGKVFYRRLHERIEAQPGVLAVSYAEDVPLGFDGGSWEDIEVEGYLPRPGENMKIYRNIVAPGYFELMRIPLRAGRDFTEQDDETARSVVIVNETFARRFLPGQNPLGRHVRGWGRPLTIVGVVKDIKYQNLDESPQPYLYVPFLQFYRADMGIGVHIRTAGRPESLLATVRREVQAQDATVSIFAALSLTEYIGASLFAHKMTAILLSFLGALALVLAAVGIYGVISYSVSQRTHEIGIRMALGAQPRDIFRLVVGQGMVLTLIGVGVGLVASFALTRFLSSLLFGVSATDPATFAGVAVLLAAVALLACYVPARRATRVDPLVALRYE